MGRLTTHVLDTANGRPGAGIRITLYRNLGERYALITDARHQCRRPLRRAAARRRGLHAAGRYRLVFAAGEYFAGTGASHCPIRRSSTRSCSTSASPTRPRTTTCRCSCRRGAARPTGAADAHGSLRRRVGAAADPLGPPDHRHRVDRRVVLLRLPRQQPAAAQAEGRRRRRHRRRTVGDPRRRLLSRAEVPGRAGRRCPNRCTGSSGRRTGRGCPASRCSSSCTTRTPTST